MDQIPETLYKYIRWSDDENDVRKNILYKNILHFASPVSFNDPFDSMLPVLFHEDYYRTEQFYIDFLTGMRQIGDNNYTPDEIKIKAREFLDNPSKIVLISEKMTEGVKYQTIKHTKISCFTVDPINILMWSHYANCHTGICIGFKTEYVDQNLVMIKKVNYSNEFPRLKKINNIPLMTTKSLEWQYENEYRFITIDATEISFDRRAISHIIIGYKMQESLTMDLVNYLRMHYPEIGIYTSHPSSTKFEIELNKIQ